MEYSVFKKEFKSYVLANDEWNIKEENYFLYEDGFTCIPIITSLSFTNLILLNVIKVVSTSTLVS